MIDEAGALTPAPKQAEGEVRIEDQYGRELNERRIPLMNWDGYMTNPALQLTVVPPEDATYPAQVTLSANDPRFYFDRPSIAGPNGPRKSMWFSNADPQTVRMAVFPSRGFHRGEHALEAEFSSGGNSTTVTIPVEVVNARRFRDRDPGPVQVDFERDRTGHDWFRGHRAQTADAAADDWGYFLRSGLDAVDAGEQRTRVCDHPRGGAPMATYDGQVQRRDGEVLEPQLWRSGLVDIEMDGNRDRNGWHERLDDTRWYELDTLNNDNDLYSVIMHEIGHALAFNDQYEAFAQGGQIESAALDAYFGGPVAINGNDRRGSAEPLRCLRQRFPRRDAGGALADHQARPVAP